MSTRFDERNPNLMIVVPPNSEAVLSAQRLGIKERTVTGYYLSNKTEQVQTFLGGFFGTYTVDLISSYYLCKDFFADLNTHCSEYYRDALDDFNSKLRLIEAFISSGKESELFFDVSLRIVNSGKYLKIEGDSQYLSAFKGILLGDIVEMVFKKNGISDYVIYLRPRGDVANYVKDYDLFGRWIKENL